jgi:hypothetical protein
MPSAGRHSATDAHVCLDLFVHQRLDLVRFGVADDDQSSVVADEVRQLVVVQHLRKALEDLRLLRVVDMRLCLGTRLASELSHQRVEQPEDLQIVLLLRRPADDGLHRRLACVEDRRQRIGDDEGAERRAADDDEFPRLPDHAEMAAQRCKASEQRGECYCQADDEVQKATY